MKESAGLLLFRRRQGAIEVFLVHPGGPFWATKDLGAWSIPKGELAGAEDRLSAAHREFSEETGVMPDRGNELPLGSVRQRAGKVVHAWAVEGDLDPDLIQSNTFTMQWPPGSGLMVEVPEVDRGAWFDLETAGVKLNPAQREFLDRLTLLATG
ncbi:MAG: NUDIX domain-containing protein [Acidimicrobiia bacterium]|nr:NUDIX domain-containing protein [Acidimicrobiia bacterium]